MTLQELKTIAQNATPRWSAREQNPASIMRQFEIVQATGGVLFRSTSYGRMREDAEFIGSVNPHTVLALIARCEALSLALENILSLKAGVQELMVDELGFKAFAQHKAAQALSYHGTDVSLDRARDL